MFWMFVSIVVLVVGMFNAKRLNSMFDKPTIEELDNFQEAVFLHIDDEISKYKKDIADFYDKEGKPMVNEINKLIIEVDDKLRELKEIEKRIDEKIIKYNNFKKII